MQPWSSSPWINSERILGGSTVLDSVMGAWGTTNRLQQSEAEAFPVDQHKVPGQVDDLRRQSLLPAFFIQLPQREDHINC